jgi:AAA domain-containing protein
MPSSPRKAKPAAVLNREQGDDVLRYWLSALRLEEALQIRPQARRSAPGGTEPRLDQPTPGQDYFKLPLDGGLVELLSKQVQLKRPFDAELCGFFETWLYGQYRRSDDEGELSHLLGFPVVHLPKGELAGLVRCGVRLRFGAGEGKPFKAPSRAERQRNSLPPAPDQVRLTRVPKADTAWPFFIDTRLLRQPLAVPGESIDALYEALRTLETVSEQQMLALLTKTLEDVASRNPRELESVTAQAERLKAAVAAEGCDVMAWVPRLTDAVRLLLAQSGSRARVYPVAIVVDGTQTKVTWHLQREINALLDAEGGSRWKLATPLGAYLTGQAQASGEAPQRALFPGPALTESQRSAAEHFWGSRLSAVQGPPGTGKTSLILHLCAEMLVRQVEPLLDGGRMTGTLLVITSSNNRAVDNVIEPLSSGDGLPLALRAGSRQICEQQLAARLRRTLAWLKRAEGEPQSERAERFAQASAQLRDARAAVDQVLAPRRAAQQRATLRKRLECALEQHAEMSADGAVDVPAELSAALTVAIATLEGRLRALSKLCESAPGHAPLQALKRHYKRTAKSDLPAFQQALAGAGLTLALPALPPALGQDAPAEQQMERWEELAELGLSRLAELRARLERGAARAKQVAEQQRLGEELTALGPESALPPKVSENHDRLSQTLFAAAVALREAWASQAASELVRAVGTALRTVEQERSLRPLFRNEPDAARSLCRLFGIWGSTLLSLGNCFPSDLCGIARLVIDEAGQCHPAHAVSALMRAESALVIGDVHQLTPVIDLNADDEARLLRACRLATPTSLLLPYRIHAEAGASTQSVADRAVSRRVALVDHFRCQREIIALSDQLCRYGLTVHTPRAARTQQAPYLSHPVSLIDLRGAQAALAGSWCNEVELRETLTLVESLLLSGVLAAELAVITPYRGQLERLRRSFAERRIPLEFSAELGESEVGSGHHRDGVALGTVHRFQGGERSIVLFSSVVTHPASLGFLNARPNLLNVAISRAKHHFICLGHAPVLAQGPCTRLLTDGIPALSPTAYGGNGGSRALGLFSPPQAAEG